MAENQGLLADGWRRLGLNKRYIVWFYLLNLLIAGFGTAAFNHQAGAILDHSIYSERLLRGFDIGVLVEMIARPEFGPTDASATSALHFALFFLLATALFLPGVFQGYASTYRLPREDFFRACGRNLWRFIRLLIVAAIVFAIVAGALFGIRMPLLKKAAESTNELLPFYVSLASLCVIFLVMTVLRIWFDLAEADVVLSDQKAVRKSIYAALQPAFRHLGQLLASYVVTTIVAGIILLAGIWLWRHAVAPDRVWRAFLVSQLTLFLLLLPRFWQRGIAVAYWQREMMVHTVPPLASAPVTVPSGVVASSAPVV